MSLQDHTRIIIKNNTIIDNLYDKAFHTEDISAHQFLVTGGAGFIGSHLVEYLLKHKAKKIIIIDNLSTGNLANIQEFLDSDVVTFHESDINDIKLMTELCSEVDYVFHQAALGSVPRSIKDPMPTHFSNATGFLSVLEACRKGGVKRLIYASSSSVYGDSSELPKREENIGRPKSPYAVTKLMDEYYAELYSKMHGLSTIGLRYFNIYGPRQNPNGPYAAAIPLFILEALNNGKAVVFGDGEQSRDFTFVENAIQGNIKAIFSDKNVSGAFINIACGERYSLNEVLQEIRAITKCDFDIEYKEERKGDIRDSHASINKAIDLLEYNPDIKLREGLEKSISWYKAHSF